MKAINHNSVLKGYTLFSVCMLFTILLFITMSYCYVLTYINESSKIESRSDVFDHIFASQVNVVERVDSLYSYITLVNSDVRINNVAVQNTVSGKKMSLLSDLEKMNDKDVLLYKRLINSVNKFLIVKDSIGIVSNMEDIVRQDLNRCITADRQAARKLSLDGVNR